MSILNELVLVDLPLFTPEDLIPGGRLTEKADKALDEGIKLLPSSRKTWINPAFVVGLEPVHVSGWVGISTFCVPASLRPKLSRLVDSKGIAALHLSGSSAPIYIVGTPEEVAMTLMGATMDEDDYDEGEPVAVLDISSEVM